MTARTLRFDFPLPPRLNTNAFRGHWGRAAREKKLWYADCDARQALGLLPPPPVKPFARAVYHATLRVSRIHDTDNAVHRAGKFPLDWLKTRGYIVDDSPKVIQWDGFPHQVTTANHLPKSVEVVLTELHASLGEVRQPVWPDVPSPFSETSEYP